MKKKCINYLVALSMIASMSFSVFNPLSSNTLKVYAADDETIVVEEKEGVIQGDITYKLDSSGVLHIYNPNEITPPTTTEGLREYTSSNETHITNSISNVLTGDGVDVTKIKEIKFENSVVFDSMYQMFKDMESLTTVNWKKMRPNSSFGSHENTVEYYSRVTHYEQMFYNCKNIKEIDLSCLFGGSYFSETDFYKSCASWQSNLEEAFYGCDNLEKIDFGNTDLSYLVSICYRCNYQNRQYNNNYKYLSDTKTICSFGKDDNRNYFYDWSTYYHKKESDSTSSTRLVGYITRSPIVFKLLYYKTKYDAEGGTTGSYQQTLDFTAEDEIVNLPVAEDEYDKVAAYKWAFNNYKYNDWDIPDSYREDEFTSFNPQEFLSLFIKPNSNNTEASSLTGPFGMISVTDVHFDGQTPTMEIRDMLVPVLAKEKEIEYDINYKYLYNGEEIAVDDNEYCIPNEKNVDKMVGKTQRIYLPYLYNTAYDNGVRVERIEYAFDNGSTVVISNSDSSYLNIDNKYAQSNAKTVTVIYYLKTYTSDEIADIDKYIKQLTEKDMSDVSDTTEDTTGEEPATEEITPPGITDDDPVVDFSTEDTTDNSTTESTVIDNKTEETKQGDNTAEIQTPTLVVKEEKTTEAPATTDGSYKSEITIATQTTGEIGETIKRDLTLSKVKGIKGVNKKGKKAYITWKVVKNAEEYELQIATKKNMKKNMKSTITTKTKLTTSKLNKGTYYFRVRAVNGDVKGSWSKVIKVKVKK